MRKSVSFGAIPTAEVFGIGRRANGAALSGDIAQEINWTNMLYNCLVNALKYLDICEINEIKFVSIILHHPVLAIL